MIVQENELLVDFTLILLQLTAIGSDREDRYDDGTKVLCHDDDDAHLYSTVTPCCGSTISALGRIVSFEACCQWALLSVHIH